MKLSILIVFCLFISFTQMQAQIFGGKPKMTDDIKYYPEVKHKSVSSNHSNNQITDISEISLPVVEKVFPGVKMHKISYDIASMPFGGGKGKNVVYYPYYKGKYWNRPEYLPELELKTNKNKLSLVSLKERIEAYATITFYKDIKNIIILDSINKRNVNIIDENDKPIDVYDVIFIINGNKYKGVVSVYYGGVLFELSFVYFKKYGITYNNTNYFQKKTKNVGINIINSESPENNNYYFNINANNNVKVEVFGLNSNENIHLLFYKAYDQINQSVEIYNIPLVANTQGEATYNYSESTCKTGAYKFLIIREDGTQKPITSLFFIPEDRIEGTFPSPNSLNYKYCIYATEMFYNSASLNCTYQEFRTSVEQTLRNSWSLYIGSMGFLPVKDHNGVLEVYLHNFFESGGFRYHSNLENHDFGYGNEQDPISFNQLQTTSVFNKKDYIIQADMNFPNIIPISEMAHYSVTTDFIKSAFTHEFFHSIQSTYNLNWIGNANQEWFIEGTARFMQTIFLKYYPPNVEFNSGSIYLYNADSYLQNSIYSSNTTSFHNNNYDTDVGALKNVSYDYCLYWRFLSEKNETNTLNTIKYCLQYMKTSYDLGDINNKLSVSLVGLYDNYLSSLHEFAKKIYKINVPSEWDNNASYAQPSIERFSYTNPSLSENIKMKAAYGISIHEISDITISSGNTPNPFNIQFTTGWTDKYQVNILVLHNNQLSQDDIRSVSNQLTVTKEFYTGDKLVLIFIGNKSSDNSNEITYTITHQDGFQANFTPTSATIVAGNSVQFHDISSDICSRMWTFSGGNPSSSTDQNPVVQYSTAGTYPVSLTITAGAVSSTKTIQSCVNVASSSQFMADFNYSTDQYNNKLIYFTDMSGGSPVAYQWDFDDGETSTLKNPSHVYATYGTYNVSLSVQYSYGYTATSKTLEVIEHGDISIAGKVYKNLNPVAGASVYALDGSNNLISSAVSLADGSYSINVPYSFTGKVYAEQQGYYGTPATFFEQTNSATNIDLYLYPMQGYLQVTNLGGTTYEFEAKDEPYTSQYYDWFITPDPLSQAGNYEISTGFIDKLDQYFQPQNSVGSYTIECLVTDINQNQFILTTNLIIPANVNVQTAYEYYNGCVAFPLGGDCFHVQDLSTPFNSISHVNINFGDNTTGVEYWDNPNCLYSDSKYPTHFIYTGNCRTFEHCYSNPGVFHGNMTAYNAANSSYNSVYFDAVIVNCNTNSVNFANTISYNKNNVINFYSGTHNISNHTFASNQNVNVLACSEIDIEGMVDIGPSLNYEVNFEIDPCLQTHQSHGSKEEYISPYYYQDNGYIDSTMFTENIMHLFPNPNNGNFTLRCDKESIEKVEIYDSMGQKIYNRDNIDTFQQEISVTILNSGIYYVQVWTLKHIYSLKVIVSKLL